MDERYLVNINGEIFIDPDFSHLILMSGEYTYGGTYFKLNYAMAFKGLLDLEIFIKEEGWAHLD